MLVLEGIIEHADDWVGVNSHPYKKHPIIKAKGVPTLLLIQNQIELMRADKHADFQNSDLLEKIAEPAYEMSEKEFVKLIDDFL